MTERDDRPGKDVAAEASGRGARAGEIDALGALIPGGRAAQLAGILTDADVATLRHLAERGMGANSLRALASDLGYLEAWSLAATGSPLPWPAPQALVLKFVAHHLWDPERRSRDPGHGMPESVRAALITESLLRSTGPHAPATVRRRLSSWSTLHRWRDVTGPFGSPALRKALRLAVRASPRTRQRKSREAVVVEVLARVLERLDVEAAARPAGDVRGRRTARLRALRDRAMLSLAFAAGGRRRSEIAALEIGQVEWRRAEAGADPAEAPALLISLGRTKTTAADDGARVRVRGRAIGDLEAWCRAAGIRSGAMFRRIDRWGRIGGAALTPQAVNLVLKARCAAAGLDPDEFSAHGLRSGYLTEAFLQGVSLPEAMAQSGHRSASQAASYFTAAEGRTGRASGLLD